MDWGVITCVNPELFQLGQPRLLSPIMYPMIYPPNISLIYPCTPPPNSLYLALCYLLQHYQLLLLPHIDHLTGLLQYPAPKQKSPCAPEGLTVWACKPLTTGYGLMVRDGLLCLSYKTRVSFSSVPGTGHPSSPPILCSDPTSLGTLTRTGKFGPFYPTVSCVHLKVRYLPHMLHSLSI